MLFILTSSEIFENKCYVTDLLFAYCYFSMLFFSIFCPLSSLFIPVLLITASICGCILLLTHPSGFLLLIEH